MLRAVPHRKRQEEAPPPACSAAAAHPPPCPAVAVPTWYGRMDGNLRDIARRPRALFEHQSFIQLPSQTVVYALSNETVLTGGNHSIVTESSPRAIREAPHSPRVNQEPTRRWGG